VFRLFRAVFLEPPGTINLKRSQLPFHPELHIPQIIEYFLCFMYKTGIHIKMIPKYKNLSNRKSTYFNKKCTIFEIILKTKKYKALLQQKSLFRGSRLPFQMLKTELKDGSQQGRMDRKFRPKRRTRAKRTEVRKSIEKKTSV
jgi:hypothetical protein